MSGMRELKTIERPGVPSVWTKSVYTGDLLAAEYDSDGTRYTYLWGPDRTPLSVTRTRPGQPAETFAYHTDALGSVVALTDEDGVAVATYEHDPYGRPLMPWTQDPIGERNPLRYRAYYADAETGMFYLPARYYDPATYRFLSPDPAPPSAGDPLSLNAFVYCLGDPVGASDPSGAVPDWVFECPRGVLAGMHIRNGLLRGDFGWERRHRFSRALHSYHGRPTRFVDALGKSHEPVARPAESAAANADLWDYGEKLYNDISGNATASVSLGVILNWVDWDLADGSGYSGELDSWFPTLGVGPPIGLGYYWFGGKGQHVTPGASVQGQIAVMLGVGRGVKLTEPDRLVFEPFWQGGAGLGLSGGLVFVIDNPFVDR